MGFSVVRDHEGQQHGSSCGIVAAHISAALKEARDQFMTGTTTDATQWHVIEAANINALRRPPFDTSVTTGHEVEEAADYFNRGPSILFRESAVRTHNGDTVNPSCLLLVLVSFDILRLDAQKTVVRTVATHLKISKVSSIDRPLK